MDKTYTAFRKRIGTKALREIFGKNFTKKQLDYMCLEMYEHIVKRDKDKSDIQQFHEVYENWMARRLSELDHPPTSEEEEDKLEEEFRIAWNNAMKRRTM